MSESNTKFCAECGTKIEDGAKFCPNCGKPIDQEPAQQSETPKQQSENKEQPEEQNVRFCPKCGAKNQVNDKFCFECGYVLDESQLVTAPSGTSQQTQTKEEKKKENKENKENKEKKGIKLWAVVGIAAVLIVAVAGAAVFMLNRDSDSEDKVQPLLYLKDNELTTVTGRKNQPFLVTDKYFEDEVKDNASLSSGNIYLLQYTNDGKYMFYPKRMNSSGRYDLYYRQANGKGEEEKQDSDVYRYVAVSKNMVVYLKGTDRRLYVSDLKDKEKLADEVWDFWVTEDGRYVMWTQQDGDDMKLYVQDTKKSEKKKIDTITSLIDYSKDFSVLVYWKDGSVYVCRNFEDKENVARDIARVYTFNIDTKLEIYYVKEGDTEYTLYDFFADKNAAADASMREPVIEDYQTVTIEDSFWGPQKVTDSKYYEELEKYNEKVARDSLREKLQSYSNGYVKEEKVYHYVLGKEDKTLVAEYVGDSLEAVYGDAPMVYYVELDMGKFNEEKPDISLFADNDQDEVMMQMNNSMVECANVKLIAENSITELTGLNAGDINNLAMYYNEKTKQIYIRAVLDGNNDLYTWDYKKNKECELLTEQIDSIVLCTEDGIYYTADINDSRSSADLYLNDTRLESDVYPYSVKEYDGTLLYIRDVDSNRQEGVLYSWKNNKREKIDDDVAIGTYGMVDDGSIAYLIDYSFKYYRGDLMLYNGKKSTKIDTDVTCIFFERKWNGL